MKYGTLIENSTSPEQMDHLKKDVLGLLNRSMSQHGLAMVVEDWLKQHDLITQIISHRVMENWPTVFSGKPWPLLSLRDNVFQSDKATKVRLIKPSVLRQSIINWIKIGTLFLPA